MSNKSATIEPRATSHEADSYPLISVIVPVYNTEKYLDRCVASILGQTYRNLEVILVDDGSPDNCPAMCDEWAKKDSRIRVIHKENGGLSSARNAGLDTMTGELVGFVDSDDYIAPEMYERLYELMQTNDADLSMCDYISVDEEGNRVPEQISTPLIKNAVFSREEMFFVLFKDGTPGRLGTAWNKLYKAATFSTLRYTEGMIYEDAIIIHKIIGACKKIATTDRVLYFYVQRNGSITSDVYKAAFHSEYFRSYTHVYKNRHNYFMSINQPELAEISFLNLYGLLITHLRKANYLKHKSEMRPILHEVLCFLIKSKSLRNKYRLCKLCLMCLLSIFRFN